MTSGISKLIPPFRNSLRKILRNFSVRNERDFYEEVMEKVNSYTKELTKGQYGGLKKLGRLPVKRSTGLAIRLQSLGYVGMGTLPSSWVNPPNGPNRIGTLQSQLSFWKGQKRKIQNRILNA